MIDPHTTILAGVMGDPVSHSLSPRIHMHWLREYAIAGSYTPLRTSRDHFSTAIAGLQAAGFCGVNVTIPHKIAAFALAHSHDRAALLSGAVNVLLFRGETIEGRNTDSYGIAASLEASLGVGHLRNATVCVVGAGGAARATIIAIDQAGARDIRVLCRNPVRAGAMARDLSAVTTATLRILEFADAEEALDGASLLVNATNAGMQGQPPLSLALDTLPRAAVVCDIVYDPLETPLLQSARSKGHHTIDGLGMLMHQAVPAFAAFFGPTPTVSAALRMELEKALDHGN